MDKKEQKKQIRKRQEPKNFKQKINSKSNVTRNER